MREYKDAMGFTWNVEIGAWPVMQAMRELRANLHECLFQRPQEFYLAAFWWAVERQAKNNAITRDSFERERITLTDLFPNGRFSKFVATQIEEALPKAPEEDAGETVAGENL